jgi:hypothetical protein
MDRLSSSKYFIVHASKLNPHAGAGMGILRLVAVITDVIVNTTLKTQMGLIPYFPGIRAHGFLVVFDNKMDWKAMISAVLYRLVRNSGFRSHVSHKAVNPGILAAPLNGHRRTDSNGKYSADHRRRVNPVFGKAKGYRSPRQYLVADKLSRHALKQALIMGTP